MKLRLKISNILLILGGFLLCNFAQFWNVHNYNQGSEIVLKNKSEELNELSSENLNLIRQAYDDIKKSNEIDLNNNSIKKLLAHKIDLSVFEGQKPVFWTNNAFNVRPQYYYGAQIQEHLNNYVVIKPYTWGGKEFIFTYNLIKNPQYSFLGYQVNSLEKRNKYSLVQNPIEGSIATEIVGLPMFYLVIDQYYSPLFYSFMLVLGLVLACIGIYKFFKQQNNTHLGVFCIMVLLILAEFLFYKNIILWDLKVLNMFAPEIFASNWFAPNLGTLLFNCILIFGLLLYISYQCNNNNTLSKIKKPVWNWVLLIALWTIYTVLLYNYISKLVTDSSLSFNFYEIFLFNRYTFIALVIIFISFLSFFSILFYVKQLEPSGLPLKRKVIYSTLTIAVVCLAAYWIFELPSFIAKIAGLSCLVYLYIDNLEHENGNFKIITRTLVPCIFISVLFHKYMLQKDLDHRDTIAAKLLLQNEREPMVKLVKNEIGLEKDLGIIDYYTCHDISKTEFEARIRQVYFNTFSDNYETVVLDFDKNKQPYREKNAYDFDAIDTLYNSKTCKPVSSHFTLVTEKTLKGSYLGKFEAYNDTAFYGTYFILMKPIVNAAPGKLSQIFDKSPIDALFDQNQYSYAIYSQNKLTRRFGSYKYNTELSNNSRYFSQNNYSHYRYQDDLGNVILVSKPNLTVIQSISSFTLLALCTIIAIIFYYMVLLARRGFSSNNENRRDKMKFLSFLKNRYRFPFWSKLYLSNKLQLYIVAVVFITFCIILFVTVRFFNNSYKTRQVNFLWDKSTQIANQLGTQANINAVFNYNQNNLLYDLSNYYNSDINLYDPHGKLIFSSNDKIYEQDLIGKLMRPEVYYILTKGKKSGIISNEKIGNLNYISSYLSIFDNDQNLRGFINLPYFTNEQDLIREISNYSATLINLFALVFALAALIAYIIGQQIIKPLNVVRKELSQIKLGNKYKPLTYKNNDEIGLLISEYNKMLVQLEDSTNKLAESERQGAWREMAKQVAHEIKNPLTPMKLTLQHLQLSIQRKDEDLAEKVSKTSHLLINQIETMSKMAEEFSSFAKMPESFAEKTNINELIQNTCDLFSTEKNVNITCHAPSQQYYAQVDKQQLGRVFTNLLKNAIQAIPAGNKGKIHSELSAENDQITIKITDNGKGIPAELYPKIFSPNFSTKNSGMGLGLAMSKKIIEGFNGKIWFESQENKGTTFFISLPQINV